MHIINEGTLCFYGEPSSNVTLENRTGGTVHIFDKRFDPSYLPLPTNGGYHSNTEISVLSGNYVALEAPKLGKLTDLINQF